MLGWWRRRRTRPDDVTADANAYLVRQGLYAYRLAGERAMDAYLLGDLDDLRYWSEVRAVIRETMAPNASVEELERLYWGRLPRLAHRRHVGDDHG